MNKFILILLSSHLAYLPQTFTLPNKQEDLFHEINRHLESTLNDLFMLLQLNKNFTHESKNRILLSIHGNIKTVAESNYKAYKIVAKSSKLAYKYKHSGGVNFKKLCEMIVQEILAPINATKTKQTNNTGINLHLTPIEIPDKLEDSISFLREYFSNVEDTHDVNKELPLYKIKEEYEKNRKAKRRRNLRAWKPTNDTKDEPMNFSDTRRLYHGKNVKIKKYPFLASVHVMQQFVCAGSIISKNMILTAATCLHVALTSKSFLEDNPEGIQVRVGSAYTQRFGEVRYATQIFFHPNYNIEDLHNNLAILQIEKLFFAKDKKIRRIEYARWKGGLPRRVKDIIMLGWGDKETQISGEFDPLSYSFLNIFDQTKCTVTYSGKYVDEHNFCAGFVNKGSGACQRDVGGPAIWGSTLIGVVSFGPPVCGTPNAPTVFSTISYHTAWIDSIVNVSLSKKQGRSHIGNSFTNEYQNNKVSLELEQRSQTIPTAPATENKSIVIPKSQYPQAIQVLQHLLTKLTKDENNTKFAEYDDEKNSKEGIVVNFDELAKIHKKQKAAKTLVNRFYNQGGLNVMRAQKDYENEAKQDDIVINGSKIIDDVVTGFQTELIRQSLMTGSRDPFFLAVKSLGSYLGLEKILHLTEDYKLLSSTTNNVELRHRLKTMPYREMFSTRSKQKSTTTSWNLGIEYFAPTRSQVQVKADDSNNNINLETTTDESHFKLKDTETTLSNPNDIVTINDEESIEVDESNSTDSDTNDLSDNYESESKGLSIENRSVNKVQTDIDRTQQFLNKNFVKDNSVILTSNQKSDELIVVLVSKATTKMTETPDNKLRQQLRLDLNDTPIMLPSRFSVISNMENLFLVETNGTNGMVENQLHFTVDQVPEFFTNKPVRTVDDNDYRKILLSQTMAPGPRYRANTFGKTNELTVITSPLIEASTDNTFTTENDYTTNNSLINNMSTAKYVDDSNGIASTIPNIAFKEAASTVSNISTSTFERDLTMAAYDIAEVVKEVEEDKKDEDETDSDIDGSRRLLDYINIT